MPTTVANWPDPASVVVGAGHKIYTVPSTSFDPGGKKHGTTRVLKVMGLGTEGLIKWSANEERKAVLEAAGVVYGKREDLSAVQFVAEVESALGPARQHQKQLAKGGEIGSAIHQAIHWMMRRELGQDAGPEPILSDAALVGFMAFQDYWKGRGLKVVRAEQPVWDKEYAGTADIFAEDPKRGLGVLDVKSSRAIYDEAHIQATMYRHAASNWHEVTWGEIVRVPKSINDPAFEVKPVGELYNRQLTHDQMMDVAHGCLTIYKALVA